MKKFIIFMISSLYFCIWNKPASAIEFNLSGNWVMSFGYGENGRFQGTYKAFSPTSWNGSQDNFEPVQRVILQLEAMISDNLSGTVKFETGDSTWGQFSTGGALGSDSKIIELSAAYIDWGIPDISVKTRMGIQHISTPAYASGNSIFNAQVASVVINTELTDIAGITTFWARPYNDNFPGWDSRKSMPSQISYLDNVDAFGIMLPFAITGATLTPWSMYAMLGPNTFRKINSAYPFGNIGYLGGGSSYFMSGIFPVGGARHKNFGNASKNIGAYGSAWWTGISGIYNRLKNLSFAFDFEYGTVAWPGDSRLARSGWFATLLFEYETDWGKPSLYGWYGSGDNSNPADGSERLPALDPDNANNYSWFAYDGSPWIERCAVIGHNMAGTWGIGARIKNLSFIENLTHIGRMNYIRGTNNPAMAKKMSLAGLWTNGMELDFNNLGSGADLGMPGLYLTSLDCALELGSTTRYQLFENLEICIEADYVFLWLNTGGSDWGARHKEGKAIPGTKGAWNVNISLVYDF